jgi:hypothetical protein
VVAEAVGEYTTSDQNLGDHAATYQDAYHAAPAHDRATIEIQTKEICHKKANSVYSSSELEYSCSPNIVGVQTLQVKLPGNNSLIGI